MGRWGLWKSPVEVLKAVEVVMFIGIGGIPLIGIGIPLIGVYQLC